MRRLIAAIAALILVSLATPASAQAVVAHIDLSTQSMDVWVNGWRQYTWQISTARSGYRTPTGSFRPQRMYRRYFSRKYYNSPMPYSIFFHGGYAIHGTNDLKRLGRPASHGCVRLHPRDASTLYSLVNAYGRKNTSIVITR